jgi:lysozyme family protein
MRRIAAMCDRAANWYLTGTCFNREMALKFNEEVGIIFHSFLRNKLEKKWEELSIRLKEYEDLKSKHNVVIPIRQR